MACFDKRHVDPLAESAESAKSNPSGSMDPGTNPKKGSSLEAEAHSARRCPSLPKQPEVPPRPQPSILVTLSSKQPCTASHVSFSRFERPSTPNGSTEVTAWVWGPRLGTARKALDLQTPSWRLWWTWSPVATSPRRCEVPKLAVAKATLKPIGKH